MSQTSNLKIRKEKKLNPSTEIVDKNEEISEKENKKNTDKFKNLMKQIPKLLFKMKSKISNIIN